MWTSSIGDDFAAYWQEKTGEETFGDTGMLDFGLGADDLAAETVEAMRAECVGFIEANSADLDAHGNASGAGHDFWLTRNGHGAGFWDRGLGALGERLSDMARPYGESYLYLGDDELVYVA